MNRKLTDLSVAFGSSSVLVAGQRKPLTVSGVGLSTGDVLAWVPLNLSDADNTAEGAAAFAAALSDNACAGLHGGATLAHNMTLVEVASAGGENGTWVNGTWANGSSAAASSDPLAVRSATTTLLVKLRRKR